jgi:hypothetical protein
MTDKGPSIAWTDFARMVPNGSWVRQLTGSTLARLDLPVEGVLFFEDIDEIKATTIQDSSLLKVTPTSGLETVVLCAGRMEFKVGDGEWIDFRTLCIRATERRLEEVKAAAGGDLHPLQWMTHPGELNMSIAQIGAMLYDVASWIETSGNKGYSDNDLLKALPGLRIKVLGNAYKLAWESILFYGDGSRKRDFAGWGVHKYKPAHWTLTWLERFGLDNPQAEILTDKIWDEALAEQAKRAVKRLQATCAGIDLEQAETRDVAHKAAAMWLLSEWAQHRAWRGLRLREMWKVQSALYHDAYKVFRQELLYRQDQQPQPRRSKKKTQAAREDWTTASRYFVSGRGFYPRPDFDAHAFYTAAYVAACCESDVMPDLAVDFDALPRDIQASDGAETINNSDETEV